MAEFAPIGVEAVVQGLGKFNSDIGKMNSKIGSVEGSANKVGSSFSGMGKKAGTAAVAIGTTFVAATAAAVAGVGLLAAAIGKVSFDFALEADGAMKSLQAQLGLTAEEAKELGQVAENVFANNFGGSLTEASNAVVAVGQQLKGLDPSQIQAATENAFRFSDAFGVGIEESLNSANALMSEFGLTQEQAFDLMTAGMQGGLNSSDDFLDSLSEYSNIFADAGFSAEQMYATMESGAKSGVLGVDKISDAVKEFGLKQLEFSDDWIDAFDLMGLNLTEMEDSVSDGETTWADWFDTIVGGINGIENPMQRAQVQAALFGTAGEDLGLSFTEGLSNAGVAVDEFGGKTAALDVQYDTLGQRFEGLKRQVLVALAPIGEALLGLAEKFMPLEGAVNGIIPIIENVANWIAVNLPLAVDQAVEAWNSTLLPAFAAMSQFVKDNVLPVLADLGTFIMGTAVPALSDMADAFTKHVMPAITSLVDIVKANLPRMRAIVVTTFVVASKVIKSFMIVMNKTVLPPLKNAFKSMTEFIAGFGLTWNDVWSALGRSTMIVAQVIGAALLAIVGAFAGLIAGVANVYENVTQSWVDIQNAAIAFKDALITVIVGIVSAIQSMMAGDFSGMFDGLKTAYTGAEGMTTAFNDAILAAIKGTFGSIIAFLGGFVEGFLGFFVTLADQLTGGDGIITGMLGMIYDAISGVGWVEALAQVMVAIIDEMITQAQNVVDAFVGAFDLIIAEIARIGGEWKDQIDTIMGLISTAITDTWDAIKTSVTTKLGLIKDEIIAKGAEWVTEATNKLTAIKDEIIARSSEWLTEISNKMASIKDEIIAQGALWLTEATNKLTAIKDEIIAQGALWLSEASSSLTSIKDEIIAQGALWLTEITTIGANILAQLIQNWLDNFNAIQTKATEIKDGIVGWGGEWLAAIATAGANILAQLIQNWIDNFNAIQTKLTEIGELISSSLQDWISEIAGAAAGFLAAGQSIMSSLLSGINNKIIEIISTVTGFVADAIELIRAGDWQAIGSDIMDGLLQGLKDNKDAVIGWMEEMAREVIRKAKAALGIDSPSKVFMEIGENITEGLTIGIQNGSAQIGSAMIGLADTVTGNFQGVIQRAEEAGKSIPELLFGEAKMVKGRAGALGSEDIATQAEAMIEMVEKIRAAGGSAGPFSTFEGLRESLTAKNEKMMRENAEAIKQATLNTIRYEHQIKRTDKRIKEAKELSAFTKGFAGTQGLRTAIGGQVSKLAELRKMLIMGTGDKRPIIEEIASRENALKNFMAQLDIRAEELRTNLAIAEAAREQARQRQEELGQTKDRNSFLGQQLSLLKSITKEGFDQAAILDSFQVGVSGEQAFTDVLIRFNEAIQQKLSAQLSDYNTELANQLALEQDLLAIEQKRAALAEEQSTLKFLQDQQKLLQDIEAFGFDQSAILQGFQIGAEADMGSFLEVMTRFTQAMIGTVEDELEISSPSKVFMRIGKQTMAGLAEGIMSMGQVPGQVMSAATNLMTQRASAPSVNTAQNNTFNTTISSQMDAAQFQAMLNRSLSNAIV